MKMKKIGILAMALVLVLGLTGAAFASWTDTLDISGTVNTGDVDLDVVKVSSTYVSKPVGTHDMVVTHGWEPLNPPPDVIASAVAEIDAGEDTDSVTVTCTNLFPSANFKVDFLIHYDGSIPARIKIGSPGSDDDITFTGTNAAFFNGLWPTVYGSPDYNNYPNDPEVAFYGEMWPSDIDGSIVGANIPDLEGYQLHKCNYILLVITLHLPEDTPMNASASFTLKIDAIQWNKYGL